MPQSWVPPPDIAEFRLERRLGRGATSDVWLARDTLLDRVVALKIASVPADGETRTRFHIEARAVAKLQHPNLIAIHHVGEIGERPFLVTEFLSGRSLDRLELPVVPERVVAIGIDLARGLAAAHDVGVLHRDIKPANAFLCEDGVAKLVDFGLAKVSGGPSGRAETSWVELDLAASPGYVKSSPHVWSSPGVLDATQAALTLSGAGTPLYMAPETWRGESATRRTDVYSLGALLYELLAGHPPYAAQSLPELRARVLAGEMTHLAQRAPWTPAPLAELVMRAMSLAQEERPTADEVCDALARLSPPRTSALAEALDDPGENPYRGLLTFGPEHRALFFGREAEAATILAELRANPFVLVAGASGAGKSSLVRAGVVPRVEKGALVAGTEWRTAVVVPGRRPTEALADAVAPLLAVSAPEVSARLAKSRVWLADELRAARARVLLVIDQLEEVWTLAAEPERAAFFEAVAAVVESAPMARVVATLRTDFLGRVEDMGALQAHALKALVVLGPMTPEGLRRAIVEPASRRGVAIEPALVERFVESGGAGSLPLLEFALGELYARRDPASSAIGIAELDALGGVEGALATHADAAMARMPAARQRSARRLLLALTTNERTRARLEERDLLGDGDPDARGALAALVAARLVVAGAGEHGAAYEVAHEALLSGWPRLRGWLDEEAGAREAAQRVRRAAREWERIGRTEGALFGERQLDELEVLAGRPLDAESDAFVRESRATLRRARLRRWALGLGAPLLIAAIVVGVRWSERRQARAFVEARLVEADRAADEVKNLDAEVMAARASAFVHYDAGDTAGGEARWREALGLARRESDAFGSASAPLGLALARDPLDPDARRRAADLTYLWLLAAERDHEASVSRDLVPRLARLDDDGSRRARLVAPAHLHVTTAPPGATVVLHAVRVEGDGRREEDEGRVIDLAAPFDLAPGSYVLTASAPGRYATRYPVLLRRGQDERVEIPLPRAEAVPAGFVFVPAGTSLYGAADVEGTRTLLTAEPEHPVHVDAFLIAAHEITFGEYLDFLATLPPEERAGLRPRGPSFTINYDRDGVPTLTPGLRRSDPLCRPARSVRRCQDWLRLPVVGVRWPDVHAYAAWLAKERVPGARLCTDHEWERAARGADGRLYPHGDALRGEDANLGTTYAMAGDQMGADEVGSFPGDRSPFGVLDLGGNVSEWVGGAEKTAVVRGGYWKGEAFGARAALRLAHYDGRSDGAGARVCAAVAGP